MDTQKDATDYSGKSIIITIHIEYTVQEPDNIHFSTVVPLCTSKPCFRPPAPDSNAPLCLLFWTPWKHHVTSLIVTGASCSTAVPNALSAAISQGHELAVPLNETYALLHTTEEVVMNSVAAVMVDLFQSAFFVTLEAPLHKLHSSRTTLCRLFLVSLPF